MNRFIPFSLAVATAALLFHIAVAQPSVEKVFRCPCTFTVSRTRENSLTTNQETFDVLISRSASSYLSKINYPSLSPFSRRKLSIRNATHSDALFHYFHHLKIADTGLFRVSVVHNSASDVQPPRYLLQLRPTSRQYVCPIMIDADMPGSRYKQHYAGRYLRNRAQADHQPSVDRVSTRSRRQIKQTPPGFEERVVGGLFVRHSLMPYLVNVYSPSGTTFCSGTLISATWVITAAHCDIDIGSDVYIKSSQIQYTDVNGGLPIVVKRVLRHPKFQVGTTTADPNDVALIELSESVDKFDVRFMALNFNPSAVVEGSYTRLAGYGRISSDNSVPDLAPLSLRQVDVPIANFRECRMMYRRKLSTVINLSRKHHFCAGYIGDGGCDGCIGDSGGAVIMYYNQEPVLIGVISGGVSCGELGIPGVNINIASHKAWLRSSGADFTEFSHTLPPVNSHCKKGERLVTRTGAMARCKKCPKDSVSQGGATVNCRKCPENMMGDPENPSICSCSRLRGMGLRKDGRCGKCPMGSFAGVGDKKCRRCPAGTFAGAVGSASCTRCDSAGRGSSSCST